MILVHVSIAFTNTIKCILYDPLTGAMELQWREGKVWR